MLALCGVYMVIYDHIYEFGGFKMNILEAIEEMKKGKICVWETHPISRRRIRALPTCEFVADGAIRMVGFDFKYCWDCGDSWESLACFYPEEVISTQWEVVM
jgi:hypothetical protein